jgi:glutamyl-tRNA synthetase
LKPILLCGRLAPTPSGYLHLGNGLAFIFTWLLVRRAGGRLLLRIDDLDAARARPEYVAAIFEDLAWLGLDYDLGPTGPDDFFARWSQTHRLDLYHQALGQLAEFTLPDGAPLMYACARSRAQLQATPGPAPLAQRQVAARLAAVADGAWRIHTPPGTQVALQPYWLSPAAPGPPLAVDLATALPDFVVRRRDGLPAYQLSTVVDDAHFGVNYVVRGQDLLPSTAAQGYLAGWLPSSPLAGVRFYHHPLVQNHQGLKLSKSAGANSLRQLRLARSGSAWLYQRLAQTLQVPQPQEVATVVDLLPHFDPAHWAKVVFGAFSDLA